MSAAAPAAPGAGLRLARGLWTLFRLIPVLSWTGGAVAVGGAAAVAAVGWRPGLLLDLALVAAGAAALQGLVAHGVNDLTDWRSGTDPLSPGLLSGGSRVIPRRLLSEGEVSGAVWLGLAVGLASAALLYVRHGPPVLLVALVGVWSTVSYTVLPLRLAYRPFVGELAAGWPAVVAIIAGTVAVLAGWPGPAVWAAATVQATISVAWVMQHHLPDIAADLAASPVKLTTPAYFALRWGPAAARLVPAGYHLAAALESAALALFLHPVFAASALLAVAGVREAWRTDVTSVPDITRRQLRMIGLCGLSALVLAAAFLTGSLGG